MEYNIERFVKEQEDCYARALKEIKNGYKSSHWMWYIFPQLKGLGKSYTANYYGIDGLEEAKQYINNEYLYNNLIEISTELLKLNTNDAYEIFNSDDKKLRSSMTLFYEATKNELFKKVIDKFFDGEFDKITINMLYKK